MRFLVASAILSVALWAVERPGAGDLAKGDRAAAKNDWAAAETHYLNARAVDPRNPAVYRRLALVSEKTGDLVSASAIYNQCLNMDLRQDECRRGLSRVEARLRTSARPKP